MQVAQELNYKMVNIKTPGETCRKRNTPALVLLIWTQIVDGGTDRRDAPDINHFLTDPQHGKACPEASSLSRNLNKSFEDFRWDTA